MLLLILRAFRCPGVSCSFTICLLDWRRLYLWQLVKSVLGGIASWRRWRLRISGEPSLVVLQAREKLPREAWLAALAMTFKYMHFSGWTMGIYCFQTCIIAASRRYPCSGSSYSKCVFGRDEASVDHSTYCSSWIWGCWQSQHLSSPLAYLEQIWGSSSFAFALSPASRWYPWISSCSSILT